VTHALRGGRARIDWRKTRTKTPTVHQYLQLFEQQLGLCPRFHAMGHICIAARVIAVDGTLLKR